LQPLVGMRRALAFLLMLGACAESPTSTSTDSLCTDAADHLDSCLPGMATERAATCGPDEQAHAEWVLDRSCDQLLREAGDGKADGIPALQGVKIRKEGSLTYFSIPLARTAQSDRGYLLDKMVSQFTSRMGEINQAMAAHGVDLSSALTGDAATDYLHHYSDTVNGIIGTNTSSDIAVTVGETVRNPTKLSTWQRYVVPQMFLAYFSAKFTANLGIGGGASATVVIAVQPWLTLAVDHTLAQPKVVSKSYDVDVDVLGIPNVDIGFGVGGGAGVRVGVGAVFGPVNQPKDLAGTGIGLSGTVTIPVLGGVSAKVVTVLKYPPLVMLMLGYSSGTSAEAEIHGNLQQILDLGAFLSWLGTKTH